MPVMGAPSPRDTLARMSASLDPQQRIPAGAHLFVTGAPQATGTDQGWVTSACYSPHLESHIALGFLEDGEARMGETIVAANPLEGEQVEVTVVSPHFIDPEGDRLRV